MHLFTAVYRVFGIHALVIELDDEAVGDGRVGLVWEQAMTVYEAAKYDF